MLGWIRKWHVLIAILFAIYFSIPKSSEPIFAPETEYLPAGSSGLVTTDGYTISLKDVKEFDSEDDELLTFKKSRVIVDERPDGAKEEDDPETFSVEVNDALLALADKRVTGNAFHWPWHRFQVNLGQDLAGGTSLRFLVRGKELVDVETRLSNLYYTWLSSENLDAFPTEVADSLRTFQQNPTRVPIFSEEQREALANANVVDASAIKELNDETALYRKAEVEFGQQDLVGPTIETLNRRLNSSGMTELNIRKVGESELEVKIPALSATQTQRIKDTLRSTGALEFLLLPNVDVLGDQSAKELYPSVPKKNSTWYQWYDVLASQTAASLDAKSELRWSPDENLYVEMDPERDSPVFGGGDANKLSLVLERTVVTKFIATNGAEKTARIHAEAVLVQKKHPKAETGYPISGKYLKSATQASDDAGRPAVSFELKGQGVAVMETITGLHNEATDDPRHLAVAIDNHIYSAPSINSKLSDSVRVTGDFSRTEVKQFVDTLKSGQLPVSLKLTSEESVGPTEGEDNIFRGMMSIVLGASLVFFFAFLVYRRVGLLTILNLTLTVLLILAVMSLFLSTLTLPGIAGLVLTLGMAIDANILINERIKEERRLGAGPKAAIEGGFKKAFSAIVDGNVTTLLTALILTKVGTGAVAGFALTLSIGILATLYTALLVYRTSMAWCFDKGIITEVRGMSLFEKSKLNVVSIGKKVAIVNLILMLGTFGYFVSRGNDNYGVDFLGGNQIVAHFTAPVSREAVTGAIESVKKPDGTPKYANSEVQARFLLKNAGEEPAEGSDSYELRIPGDTGDVVTDEQAEEVLADLHQAFNGQDGHPQLVSSGFVAQHASLSEAELSASVTIKRPENVSDERANDENWLLFASSDFSDDPDTLSREWFADIGGDVQQPSFLTSKNKQTQTITFKITGVSTSADTVDQTSASFYSVLKTQFEEKLDVELATEGFPAASEVVQTKPTKGSAGVYIRLDQTVNAEEFKNKLKTMAARIEDPIVKAGPVTVQAIGELEGENAQEFEVTTASGDILYTEDGRAQSLLALDGLQPMIEEYFGDIGSDNHISQPFPRATAVSGRVAGETQARALIALLISLIVIVIYIGIRFKSAGWGYAAVAALVHDTLFTLGALAVADALFGNVKIDLNAIAALLTVIGYSLNDTIVIFDRIREELMVDYNNNRKRNLVEVINEAVNRTLSRTVLTSASTFVVVLAMLILGGPAIRSFSLALFFGLIFGTYSSIFRAGPFLLFFTGKTRDIRLELEREQQARKEAEAAEAEALAAISVDREDEKDSVKS